MITKAFQNYATAHWSKFWESVTEISRNDQINKALVNDDTCLYNFDKISSSLFSEERRPCSVDGLCITEKCINLIEFKSGFKDKISKKNFDSEKGQCPRLKGICDDYWNLFWDKRNLEKERNIISIRDKAIESYVTLNKKILPYIKDQNVHIPLILTIVIDEDELDNMEDSLAELAQKDSISDNSFTDIKKAMKRLIIQGQEIEDQYYYDYIEVLSVCDFKNRLNIQKKNKI